MAKRHLTQTKKQALGQYFTTNAAEILKGYEHVVKNKAVIDPFAGNKDLLNWAMLNGCSINQGYDIAPVDDTIMFQDTLVTPPDYSNSVVVTNPPYLSSNKCRTGDKSPYHRWNQNDYYKCHLASLGPNGCDEALEIVPSNFFCEGRDAIRATLFKTHHIVSAKYWDQPSFDDASTGTCVLHLKRGEKRSQVFPLTLLPAGVVIDVELEAKYRYLHGKDFFDYIAKAPTLSLVKTDIGMTPPNTNIVVGLLDNGKWPVGISFNSGLPIYCQPKSFTTYQLTTPHVTLSEIEQRAIIELFHHKLTGFRKQYHSLFLANYMGPSQKILSRDYVNKLISACCQELGIEVREMAPCFSRQERV